MLGAASITGSTTEGPVVLQRQTESALRALVMTLAQVTELARAVRVAVQIACTALVIRTQGSQDDIATRPIHGRFPVEAVAQPDGVSDFVGDNTLDITFPNARIGAPFKVLFV